VRHRYVSRVSSHFLFAVGWPLVGLRPTVVLLYELGYFDGAAFRVEVDGSLSLYLFLATFLIFRLFIGISAESFF
jgi:hypothetical protein